MKKKSGKRFLGGRYVGRVWLGLALLGGGSAGAFVPESGQNYTVEMRGSGEKNIFGWDHEESSLIMNKLGYKPHLDNEVYFEDAGNNFYKISTLSNTNRLSSGTGVNEEDLLVFEADAASDAQLWRIHEVGDGTVQFVNKATGLAIGHQDDPNPSEDHHGGLAMLQNPQSGRTYWIVRPALVVPEDTICLNQNGWAPGQYKEAVLMLSNYVSSVTYSVDGPQTLSGSMTYREDKWQKSFYAADLSTLTTPGYYTFISSGLTQSFYIVEGAFSDIRREGGGVVEWGDVVDGILKSQRVKAPGDVLDSSYSYQGNRDGDPGTIVGSYTLTDGFYDASSEDNKIYRTATVYMFLAAAMLETADVSKREQVKQTVQDGIDWLVSTQNPDGSWPLGKVRVSIDGYFWSLATDPGGTARVVASLGVMAQALETIDPTRSQQAITAGEAGWDWVMANSDESDFIDIRGDYFGAQDDIIAAAMELYMATESSEYKTYADSHIHEAQYGNGLYTKASGTPWLATPEVRVLGTTRGNIIYHLGRYYDVADAITRGYLDIQFNDYINFWLNNYTTPWGFPDSLGRPNVAQGRARSISMFSVQMAKIAEITGSASAEKMALASWDYLTGKNAWGSNLFVGGRGQSKIPLWHQPWKTMDGAVVPGPIVQENSFFSFDGMDYEYTEQVVRSSLGTLPFFAIMDKLYPAASGNHAPEFFAGHFSVPDAFYDADYRVSIAGRVIDVNGDALTFSKVSGPAWLTVSSDGILTGTPTYGNRGVKEFVVRVSDDSGAYGDATLEMNIIDLIWNEAPVWLEAPVLAADGASGEAYTTSLAGWVSDENNDSLTFALADGPAWVSVASDGQVSGTPEAADAGTNVLTVTVSDGIAAPVSNAVTIAINAPVIWHSEGFFVLGDIQEDAVYTEWHHGKVTDPDDDLLTFELVSSPDWLALVRTDNGKITGTPSNDDVGSFSYVISVTDGFHTPVLATGLVEVINVNDAPVFGATDYVDFAAEGEVYAGSVTGFAADVDLLVDATESLTYSKDFGPDWLTVDDDGSLSGIPTNSGVDVFDIKVTDQSGASDLATLSITVQPMASGVEFRSDDFESGFGNWVPSGSQASLYSANAERYIGTQSIELIRSASIELGDSIDAVGFEQLVVEFSYLPRSLDTGESFVVEWSNDGGVTWTNMATYISGVDFDTTTEQWYDQSLTVTNQSNAPFSNDLTVRFVCQGNGDWDFLYLENIAIYAAMEPELVGWWAFSEDNSSASTLNAINSEPASLAGDALVSGGRLNLLGAGRVDVPVSSIASELTNSVSVSLWAWGANTLPIATSALYATDANGNRAMNIHLPWSDGNVYWDAPNVGSRVIYGSSSSEYVGRWSHWVFTKNSQTGDLKIYLDGVLEVSGSSATDLTEIDTLHFGASNTSFAYGYEGSIADLRLYTSELSAAEVAHLFSIIDVNDL